MNNKTKLKSYIFRAEIEQEEDGRWSAEIPLLPGCATWGYTKEEALQALRDAAQAYIEVLIEDGKPIPSEPKEEVEIVEAPVVAVTV
ncbi:MAG TPA: type II toxin-antitoxin system HicB family antitoxin [Thermodesulfobacteriota bacterium]|nr:type II toxin-antitoxin system HicB family antitoxin [Thermodesulfobacteriota bacterium]